MELTITPTKTHNLKEVTYDTRPLPMTQISEELSNLWNYSYDITWKRYALDNTIMIPMVTFTLVGGSWLGRWLTYTQVVVWVQILTSSFTYMGSSKKDVLHCGPMATREKSSWIELKFLAKWGLYLLKKNNTIVLPYCQGKIRKFCKHKNLIGNVLKVLIKTPLRIVFIKMPPPKLAPYFGVRPRFWLISVQNLTNHRAKFYLQVA